MPKQVIVYLRKPGAGFTAPFDLEVEHNETGGTLTGADVDRVVSFLRIDSLFDLEWDGKTLVRCRLKSAPPGGPVTFAHNGMTPVDRPSNSGSSYR